MCKPRVNRERAAAALASGLARVRLYDVLRTRGLYGSSPSFHKITSQATIRLQNGLSTIGNTV